MKIKIDDYRELEQGKVLNDEDAIVAAAFKNHCFDFEISFKEMKRHIGVCTREYQTSDGLLSVFGRTYGPKEDWNVLAWTIGPITVICNRPEEVQR